MTTIKISKEQERHKLNITARLRHFLAKGVRVSYDPSYAGELTLSFKGEKLTLTAVGDDVSYLDIG